MGRKGYEIVASALAEAGVERIFGLMGNGNMALVTAAARDYGIAYTAARHDAGALCLAQGYAFASRRPAVATVTYGPGLSNAVTALRAATDLRLPVVVILGDLDASDAHNPHDIDHRAYVELTGAAWRQVNEPFNLRRAVAEAIHGAQAQARPHVVNIPMGLMEGSVEASQVAVAPAEAGTMVPAAGPLDSAVAALASASRPVVLAGFGAVVAGALPALERVAERSGALLATTLRARGAFHGNPFLVGVSGTLGTSLSRDLLVDADVIVAVGATLDRWTTDERRLVAGTMLVQVDHELNAMGRNCPVDVAVHGDARSVAEGMLELLADDRPGHRYRTPEVVQRISRFDVADTFVDASGEDGIDPRTAMLCLGELLPRPRMITVDGGHLISWPSTYLPDDGPGTFLPAIGAGAVGHSIATAVGAWLAAPATIGVCVLGDGSLMMSLPELDTAVRAGARIVVVVMNDGAYSAEVHKLRRLGLSSELAEFPMPDVAEVMRGLGGNAVTARSVDELIALGASLQQLRSPLLVDLRVTRRVVADRFAPSGSPEASMADP